MTLPLRLQPYSVVFHAVLIAALLTGMGYALFPPKNANDIIMRLTAFFILLLVQSFLWMMRERSFKEAQAEIKELRRLNAEIIRDPLSSQSGKVIEETNG